MVHGFIDYLFVANMIGKKQGQSDASGQRTFHVIAFKQGDEPRIHCITIGYIGFDFKFHLDRPIALSNAALSKAFVGFLKRAATYWSGRIKYAPPPSKS